MIANGDPLGLELVECLSGFFIQVFVTGQPELLEDIQDALPLMARQRTVFTWTSCTVNIGQYKFMPSFLETCRLWSSLPFSMIRIVHFR